MVEDGFSKRKSDVLSKLDKSFKGGWDERIQGLCEKLNESEDYYTTSSCSGRVVLMFDEDKKGGGLFIKVYHDKISFEELKGDLMSMSKSASPDFSGGNSINGKEFSDDSKELMVSSNARGKLIKFKMEPCILHVACRDLDCAQDLFDKAKLAGWKKSGIISTKSHVMLELNSTERMEFPIVFEGKILVEDDFLKLVVGEVNKKLEKSWGKIEKFRRSLK